ncbi:two-component system, OmpR family, response regulator ArlR [Treponema bryantii]|jgi:two-component system response regulator ArlR|uniref:Two-component system, OmpR family, response regulator ArlR n=1 Tax=Treponema bryantii TaxID=163 RepID=A0A1I3L7X8_9SPIR|nr:response regulator transcription factor [Treponema bryantii]SFI80616.1 two-component system, OmpR family, response regulator ArlR [Treponema bryantii]
MKILIVEDDAGISDFVIPELEHEGYTTCLAVTGREALEKFENEKPDLVLLDIMLPELNGLEVLRRIRATSMVPVILETARGETIDKINGLNLGADDYIPKPFEIEELLARINALFRRVNFGKSQETASSIKNLTLNLDRMSFSIKNDKKQDEGDEDKVEVQLSKTEFLFLKLLIENQGKVFSRQQIIDEIWGVGHYIDENTVDVYVGYLRSKISEYTKDEYIRTVRGAGYMMG